LVIVFYTRRILITIGFVKLLRSWEFILVMTKSRGRTLKSIKKSINMWKWRNLSLLGKIQIIKTFAIPKLMFRASVIPISNDLVKEANSIFYNLIYLEWKR